MIIVWNQLPNGTQDTNKNAWFWYVSYLPQVYVPSRQTTLEEYLNGDVLRGTRFTIGQDTNAPITLTPRMNASLMAQAPLVLATSRASIVLRSPESQTTESQSPSTALREPSASVELSSTPGDTLSTPLNKNEMNS